jgi:hypothetical protein
MRRKAIIAMLALAAIGLAQPTAASSNNGGDHGGKKNLAVKAASVKATHKRPNYDGYVPSAWNVPWR